MTHDPTAPARQRSPCGTGDGRGHRGKRRSGLARSTGVGRVSWATGPTLTPSLAQQTSGSVAYSGTWTGESNTSFSGGSSRYAKAASASATYTFTGRSIGLVSVAALNRGKAKIYVDGTLVTTVDMADPTLTYRYLAYTKTWSSSGTHKIKVVVVGTSGRPRIDVDAFAVLK